MFLSILQKKWRETIENSWNYNVSTFVTWISITCDDVTMPRPCSSPNPCHSIMLVHNHHYLFLSKSNMSLISAIIPQVLTLELSTTLQKASPLPDIIKKQITSYHTSHGLSSNMGFLSLGLFFIDVNFGLSLSWNFFLHWCWIRLKTIFDRTLTTSFKGGSS